MFFTGIQKQYVAALTLQVSSHPVSHGVHIALSLYRFFIESSPLRSITVVRKQIICEGCEGVVTERI